MKAKNNSPKLDRQLGLFDSTMMVIGIVIGSGTVVSENAVIHGGG